MEEWGFHARLASRRAAYRRVGNSSLGTFVDLVIRIDAAALALVEVDEFIGRVQHALSTDPLPPEPRIGKILVSDGTEYVFPLEESDNP